MTADTAGPAPATVPSRVLNARVRNFRGKTFVAMGEQVFELTETAALAWTSIDGSRTVADIARIVCTEYDVDEETALADVSELLGTLVRAGLIEY